MTKKRKELLNEDFLSDMEQKPVSAEDVAGAPENVADDDFADLLGGKTTQEPQAAQAAEENLADTVSALKDTVNGFSVAIQEFKDYIAKQNAAPAEPAAPVEPAAPAPEASPDAPPNIDLDNAPAEGGAEPAPEAPAEQSIEDKPAEGGESAPAEGGEDESDFSQDESRPEDATKSEAYQMNRKAGKLLNSNSGTLIGIVESGKLYKLDEMIMTAVKSKIREKINEAKAQLKAEFLKEAAEMPKAEPEMIVEEKKGEEEKKPEKKTMSFLEKLKAAKACKGKACCDEKKEECKGSDDEKKDDDKKEDEKKED